MENKPNSADRLIERILAEAQAQAQSVLAAADADAERTVLSAKAEEAQIYEDAQIKAEKLREGILERSRTNAALDSRKLSLKMRRKLLDEAFDLAAQKLNAVQGEKRAKLIKKLLLDNAEGGETVLCNGAEHAALCTIIKDVNGELAQKGKQPLTLAEPADKIGAGFMLVGSGYEKNCTFAALLAIVRAQEESAVAAMLFD